MASLRKRGTKWLAEVRRGSTRTGKSFETKSAAQMWALELEQSLRAGSKVVGGKTLRDAFDKYASEISPSKKGAGWEQVRLRLFGRYPLADAMVQTLSAPDIQQWAHRRLKEVSSPATVRRELILLSSVLNTCRKQWNWMTTTPMADVTKPKSSPARDRRITEDEIKRVLLALEYDERKPVTTLRQVIAVAFLLALETGMRHGELWALRPEDVSLAQKFVTLQKTKNGSTREVALSKRAADLLKKLNMGVHERVFYVPVATAEVTFRRAVLLAGIKNLTFHDTRHEAITRLARKLDVLDLARMVGHKDLRSLQVYYNATASEIASRLENS